MAPVAPSMDDGASGGGASEGRDPAAHADEPEGERWARCPDSGLRVLTFDAGGQRGLMSLQMLFHLFGEGNGFVPGDHVDVVGGCSVGGVLAACMCRGMDFGQMFDVAHTLMDRTFSEARRVDLGGGVTLPVPLLYSGEPLQAMLGDLFGDAGLGDLPKLMLLLNKPDVALPPWPWPWPAPARFGPQRPVVFSGRDPAHGGHPVRDLVYASSAAFPILPYHKVGTHSIHTMLCCATTILLLYCSTMYAMLCYAMYCLRCPHHQVGGDVYVDGGLSGPGHVNPTGPVFRELHRSTPPAARRLSVLLNVGTGERSAAHQLDPRAVMYSYFNGERGWGSFMDTCAPLLPASGVIRVNCANNWQMFRPVPMQERDRWGINAYSVYDILIV